MKYTIELTDKQKAQMDCMIDIVHRYVGFNPKLEPIKTTNVEDTTYDVAYNKGLEDACLTAWTLLTSKNTGKIFTEYGTVSDILGNVPMKEIRNRIKAYEEKKKAEDEIRVGDEVYLLDPNEKSVVTFVDKENRMLVILTIRGKYATLRVSDAHKTGRHFGEVEQIIDKLRCENNENQ